METQYHVYILTNHRHTVLYTGVTNNLVRRVYEHREKVNSGFTNKYNADKLEYFEPTPNVIAAIEREKQIKGGPRRRKILLIEGMNPEWRDLYEDLIR
jgi:putative endonuclease